MTAMAVDWSGKFDVAVAEGNSDVAFYCLTKLPLQGAGAVRAVEKICLAFDRIRENDHFAIALTQRLLHMDVVAAVTALPKLREVAKRYENDDPGSDQGERLILREALATAIGCLEKNGV